MESFYRKDEEGKPILEGEESSVSSEDISIQVVEPSEDGDITTELSIHPEWELPKEDVYAYQFLNLECPPLKGDHISISGISLMPVDEKTYRCTAFIRNGLNNPLELREMPIVLSDGSGEILGRTIVDLSEVGEIPPKSCRPWHFYFTVKDLFTLDLPSVGWKLGFNLFREHTLDLPKEWRKSLSKEDKQKLEELVNSSTPPRPNELKFMGLNANFTSDGDFVIVALIRNGSDNSLYFHEFPLRVEDAHNDTIAEGTFKFDNLTVKPNTSQPCTFTFPSTMVHKQRPDFSDWKIYIPEVE